MFLGGGQNRGRGGAILTSNEVVLTFGVLTPVSILMKCDRESARRRTDIYTDTVTHANRYYNLSHAICYSYGTDNYYCFFCQQVACRGVLLWDNSVDLFYQGAAKIKHVFDYFKVQTKN